MRRRCRTLWLLMQILFVINHVDSSPADNTIRIGFLLQSKSRAGAINVAIEQAQNDGLLRNYNFRSVVCTVMLISVRTAVTSRYHEWIESC